MKGLVHEPHERHEQAGFRWAKPDLTWTGATVDEKRSWGSRLNSVSAEASASSERLNREPRERVLVDVGGALVGMKGASRRRLSFVGFVSFVDKTPAAA
jgi:hypothetical protein